MRVLRQAPYPCFGGRQANCLRVDRRFKPVAGKACGQWPLGEASSCSEKFAAKL